MKNVSILGIIGAVFGITLVRTFIENFSNPEPTIGFTNYFLLNGYFLFYFGLIFSLAVLFGVILKEPIVKHLRRMTLFLPIIWIAPIIDLAATNGACMAYIGKTGTSLLVTLLTYFGDLPRYCGITLGIRVEIAIILVATLWYLYKKTKRVFLSIFATLLTYCILFAHLALPGILATLFNVGGDALIMDWINQSLIVTSNAFNHLEPLTKTVTGLAIFASRPIWILVVLLAAYTLWRDFKDTFIAWLGNTRITRTIYYVVIGFSGLIASTILHSSSLGNHPLDIFSYIILGLLIILSWWLAVAINDIEDVEIDSVNSPDRPLLRGTLTKEHYRSIIILLVSLLATGGILINWNVFVMIVLFQVAYGLYSLQPLYLKKHFLGSSAMVGLAGTALFFAGYFTSAINQSIRLIPVSLLTVIFISLAIISNTKDFKDVVGDKLHNIKTLPVLFGKRRAGLLVSLTWIIWLVLLGFVTHWFISLQAIPWIILDFFVKKRVPEFVRFILIISQIIITTYYFM